MIVLFKIGLFDNFCIISNNWIL